MTARTRPVHNDGSSPSPFSSHPSREPPSRPNTPDDGRDASINAALETVRIERDALDTLALALESTRLRDDLDAAVRLLVGIAGRVVVTGMGKSGIVGRKLAATLSSTGTPATFMHSGDASHGDLGLVTPDDVVIALSWSGETAELAHIIAYCRRFRVPLVVITAQPDSTAGRAANICLVLPDVREACPHQLAPTSSAIVQLALGDALAIALMHVRGFTASDFRSLHPGGRLGAQLRPVGELMGIGDAIPRVTTGATVLEAAVEMTSKRYGCTAVVDADDNLLGSFSDGDLRRSLMGGMLNNSVAAHMSSNPHCIGERTLASDALTIMNEHKISVLFICDGRRLNGVLHIHDLLKAGVA